MTSIPPALSALIEILKRDFPSIQAIDVSPHPLMQGTLLRLQIDEIHPSRMTALVERIASFSPPSSKEGPTLSLPLIPLLLSSAEARDLLALQTLGMPKASEATASEATAPEATASEVTASEASEKKAEASKGAARSEGFASPVIGDARYPVGMIALLQKDPMHPIRLRRHLLATFDEIERVCHLIEQEFSTSGLHTLALVKKIESLGGFLMHWAFALRGETWEASSQGWLRVSELCGKDGLLAPEMATWFTHLSGLLERHRHLAIFLPQVIAENETDIDRLLQPLLASLKRLRLSCHATMTSPQEIARKRLFRKLALGSFGLVFLVSFLAAFWVFRPLTFAALRDFPHAAKSGGIAGDYFQGQDFQRFLLRRHDAMIDMRWPASPAPSVPPDQFSIRWKGFLRAPEDGTYDFCVAMDDGARLQIHDRILVNEWRIGSARTRCGKVRLQQGWHPLQLDFFERGGVAEIRLFWKPPRASHPTPIPFRDLCCRSK